MQAWIEVDDRGRQYLVRTGTGVVTAVAPVGIVGPDGEYEFYRVEIFCDAPHGRPGAIRYSAHALVGVGERLWHVAVEALDRVWPVIWTVQWRRHDWIPDDLPIVSLDLATDARGLLVALDRVVLPEPVDDESADLASLEWRDQGS